MITGRLPQVLIFLIVGWPLLIAVFTACRYFYLSGEGFARAWHRPGFTAFWVSAPVPALVGALTVYEGELLLSWFMMGGVWQIEGFRGPILGFTALLWLAAGIFAHGYLAFKVIPDRFFRFAFFWPLAMTGNLLLIIASDIPGFYAGFALMTYSAYVLVIHEGTSDARRGAKAYIIMAVIGEGLIIGGLLWGAGSLGTIMLPELRSGLAELPAGLAISFALWLGFGVKAGLFGLHTWLPLAHPVAPTPASAVLSGAMIKAGFVGWFYTIPAGLATMPALGYVAVIIGLSGAFIAVIYGVAQRDPKIVLAYSSVSQMGMIVSLLGLTFVKPSLWAVSAPLLILFIINHGLCKGALFLGTVMSGRPTRLPGVIFWLALALPALSLTGVAGIGLSIKWAVKSYLYTNELVFFSFVFALAGVGTALLMIRVLFLQYLSWKSADSERSDPMPDSMVFSWMLCVLASVGIPWWLYAPEGFVFLPPGGQLPGLLWPGAIGAVISLAVFAAARSMIFLKWREFGMTRLFLAGDVWWVYVMIARRFYLVLTTIRDGLIKRCNALRYDVEKAVIKFKTLLDYLHPGETFFRRWAGVLMVMIALLLVLVMFMD